MTWPVVPSFSYGQTGCTIPPLLDLRLRLLPCSLFRCSPQPCTTAVHRRSSPIIPCPTPCRILTIAMHRYPNRGCQPRRKRQGSSPGSGVPAMWCFTMPSRRSPPPGLACPRSSSSHVGVETPTPTSTSVPTAACASAPRPSNRYSPVLDFPPPRSSPAHVLVVSCLSRAARGFPPQLARDCDSCLVSAMR